ncbi:glycosyltransferase [Phormidesmis priestleyi]|uniref:glycosyltransferase n=1 Tax=Phormidesmis priestleyi TaxID=268141 RepID=UPI00083AED14|nr:glycosyltransferase [Phormidesmis priestleyi]
MNASVSLIVTAYNRQQFLAKTIESILAQTYSDFELLIWDDGSTDHSVAISQQYAEQDARIRVVAADHRGFASALRAAISTTTGAYLGWVDSDDLLEPTALQETISALDAAPSVGMVYTQYRVINEEGVDQGLGVRSQIPYSSDQLLVSFMTFHFRLLRRSVYEQIGGLDSSYDRAEDYDLCLRLSEVTEIQQVPKPLYCYRQHGGNMTNDQLEQIRWSYRASVAALKRRGLEESYAIDLRVVSQFVLRRV